MARSLLHSWWARARGRLVPTPCPFAQAATLASPFRAGYASPGKILGAFGLTPGERVLEIGPGIGYYSAEAARRIAPDGRLICLDIQREMLQEVGRRTSGAAAHRPWLLQGSAPELPLRSGSIDHVFLITVLGEIPDRARGLAEIRRVLRPGGRLSVSEQLPDPDFITPRSLRRELFEARFVEESTRGFLAYTSTWRRG